MNEEKEFEKLYEYQELVLENNKIIQKIETTRKEIQRIQDFHKNLISSREKEILLNQANLKKFTQERNFVQVKKTLQKIEMMKKDLVFAKVITRNIHNINLMSQKTSLLNKQIENRLTAMGMREAQAKSFIEKKIAQVKNFVDKQIVQFKINERTVQFSKLNLAKEKSNVLNNSEQMQKLKNNPLVEKRESRSKQIATAREILKDGGMRSKGNTKTLPLQNMEEKFEIKKRDNYTLYKSKENPNIKIKDYGNHLTCSSKGDRTANIKAMLDIAEKKGWNISNMKVNGSKEFREAVKAQIREREKEIKVEKAPVAEPKKAFEKLAQAKEKFAKNQPAQTKEKFQEKKQERSYQRENLI